MAVRRPGLAVEGRVAAGTVRLGRQAFAELLGSALLAATVVGSGVAAQRLSPGDVGLQLLQNSLVTGAVLVALILALGPVSAAFNPAVTLAERALGALSSRAAGLFVLAQAGGCCLGTVVANLMFELPAVELSSRERTGGGLWLGATFGLLVVVFGSCAPAGPGRSGTRSAATSPPPTGHQQHQLRQPGHHHRPDSFAGIAPGSVAMFVLMQLLGAVLAVAAVRVRYPDARRAADRLVDSSLDPATTGAAP